jgi:hypothetical protein
MTWRVICGDEQTSITAALKTNTHLMEGVTAFRNDMRFLAR